MPLVDRADSLLAVIDAQPGFYRDRNDVDAAEVDAVLERVAWVVRLATALDVPTIVTEEEPARNGPTSATVVEALAPDAPRLPKVVFALSANPAIRAALDAIHRRTAVLVGMETDVCVAHSAIALVDLGYRVVAITDAVFSPHAAHGHGLDRMRDAGVQLLGAKGLFYEWLPSLDAVRAAKSRNPRLRETPGFRL